MSRYISPNLIRPPRGVPVNSLWTIGLYVGCNVLKVVGSNIVDLIANSFGGSTGGGYETTGSSVEDNGGAPPSNSNNGGNGGDDEKLKEFFANIKKYAEKKAFVKDKNIKLFKFGDKWYSPDHAGHGGARFKRFKETKGGFELEGSVHQDGTFMTEKHESKSGLVIRKSDVKFYD